MDAPRNVGTNVEHDLAAVASTFTQSFSILSFPICGILRNGSFLHCRAFQQRQPPGLSSFCRRGSIRTGCRHGTKKAHLGMEQRLCAIETCPAAKTYPANEPPHDMLTSDPMTSYLPTYLPTYLRIYLSTDLLTVLPTYLPRNLSTYLCLRHHCLVVLDLLGGISKEAHPCRCNLCGRVHGVIWQRAFEGPPSSEIRFPRNLKSEK